MLPLDEHLRHLNGLALHPVLDLLLVVAAHEHIPLLEFHQQRPQDLLDVCALGVRFPHNAHTGRVDHHLAGVLFLVVLLEEEKKRRKEIRLGYSYGNYMAKSAKLITN